MRVLYTCVRQSATSTGYPKKTEKLNEFFFPSDCNEKIIQERLLVAFDYAMAKWDEVGEQWLGLFSQQGDDKNAVNRSNDADISTQLRTYEAMTKSSACVAAIQSSGAEGSTPEKKASAYSDGNALESRILILAIDEARALLTATKSNENQTVDNTITKYRLLRRTLANVNDQITTKYKNQSGIFVVLVDTNSKIADFVPPWELDPSYRPEQTESSSFKLFHPFVLTHTMDIYSNDKRRQASSEDVTMTDVDVSNAASSEDTTMEIYFDDHNTVFSSQSMVTQEKINIEHTISYCRKMVLEAVHDDTLAWENLVCLGRPLWRSVALKDADGQLRLGRTEKTNLVYYAARKLMLGADINDSSAFCKQTMNGVSSVLCRLGLRPYSSSALASHVVADFMAILCYVNYRHDQYISSYFSDPILTFGAAQLWHINEDVLAKHILPELTKLFMQEVLDTGGIGEAVARILLLLAMDECAEVKQKSFSLSRFFSVTSFMKTLRGPHVKYLKGDMKTETLVRELDAKWEAWWVGFSHFVQMPEEPTEESLWYLLSRRAAGMFPRNQDGADLFIPIFTCDVNGKNARVSMILIQVKNFKSGFSHLSEAARKLYPSNVFSADNELSLLDPGDVLRVIISLRGRKIRREYLKEAPKKTKEVDSEHVLLLRGIESGPSSFAKERTAKKSTSRRTKKKSKESTEANTTESGDAASENNERVLFMEGIESGPDSFVSESVAESLNHLTSPWWDMMNLVEQDLDLREKDVDKSPHSVESDDLVDIAKKPTLDLLNILKIGEAEKDKKRCAGEKLLNEEKKKSKAE